MKFDIKKRFSGEVIFSIETDSWKLAVEAAIKAKANLSWANLSGANLSWANLSKANLSKANLSGANLSGANLSGANLSWANLLGANLSKANLSGANLSKANLSKANLSTIQNDVWAILLFAPKEVKVLRQALIEGRVDGSVYKGECACLVGTIANARSCEPNDLPNSIKPNSNRPAERFFMGIKKGDTPETNPVSKIALEWVDTWLLQIGGAA